MSLQERIQARLDELNLTAITAATRKGYSRDLIRNVMRTGSRPRTDTLSLIAAALDMDPAELLDAAPTPIGQRLQERMTALGTNQYRVAKEAGMGADYVRDIIRGRVKDPSSARLHKLAEHLGVTPEWLLFGDSSVASSVADSARLQPVSRPTGPREGAASNCTLEAQPAIPHLSIARNRIRLTIDQEVSANAAQRILAILEEEG